MNREILAGLAAALLLSSCAKTPRMARVFPPAPPATQAAADEDDRDDADNPENERASADDARRFFLLRRTGSPEGPLPLDRYEAARDHIRLMPSYSFGRPGGVGVGLEENRAGQPIPLVSSPVFGQGWTSLGPGNIGGRTRSIVIHPTTPSIIYTASATGGIWKTTDAGKTWSPLTDLLPVLNFTALAMDPVDSNMLYAGSGELYGGFPGLGIFKTTDAGATWKQLSATSGFIFVNKLVVSRVNPGRIYATTTTGIWTSPDAGTTWIPVLSGLVRGCDDLVARTDTTTDYLFASCSGATQAADFGIYRNTDAAGAGQWVRVHTAAHMIRTSLAIAPSQQSTIYALAASQGGTAGYDDGLLAVFRSIANGDPGTWDARVTNTDPSPVNTSLLSATSGLCEGKPVRNQGSYDNVLAVDPADPNRVWAGGVHLLRSDDGGANWGFVDFAQLHPDHHAIAFHPAYDGNANQTLFEGNDGGVYRIDNARSSVTNCVVPVPTVLAASLNTSYVATQFYHGVAYPGGSLYLGGAQDNGISQGSDAAGPSRWNFVSSGDGGSIAVDGADVNSIFWEIQGLSLVHSPNNGESSSPSTNGITEVGFPFIAALKMDPNDGRNLFLGGITTLWRTTDAGANWTGAAPVEVASSVSAIAISPRDSNTVLFGTQTGMIYHSSGALTNNTSVPWNAARPRTGYVAGIAFDWANSNIVYATYSSFKQVSTDAHVYKSLDGGVTWTPSDGQGAGALPNIPAFAILVNPYDSNTLFLGTDLGVFVSTDGGASWAHDASPFSNVIVEDLVVDRGTRSNWLFAFTYGRGAYRAGLPGAVLPDCRYSVSPTAIVAPASGGTFPVTVSAGAGCAWATLPGTQPYNVLIQSPGQGTGNGTAYVAVAPNFSAAVTDTVTIAGVPVTVTVASSPGGVSGSDTAAGGLAINVPGAGLSDTRSFTALPSDPVHSCTGSPDFKTAWWKVTAAADGALQVWALGMRYDIPGNYGIILTAYPAASVPSQSTELACAAVAKDAETFGRTAEIPAFIRFNATAGTTYLLEASAPAGAAQDGGSTQIAVTSLAGLPSVIVSPANSQAIAGANPVTFTAKTSNTVNPLVRWSISPHLGTISADGIYTPPPAVANPAQVIVTATSFAVPSVQGTAVVQLAPLQPTISRAGILSAASFQAGSGVAPGEIVTIFGSGLGPLTAAGAQFTADGKFLATTTGGTQVLFDGVAAPIVFSYTGQLSAIVPYEVDGKTSTTVQIIYNGQTSNAVSLPVVSAAPALFTAAASGSGQAAIYNHDALANAQYPEPVGQIIVLYGTGEGQTEPPGVTGALAKSVYPKPANPVSVTIGGQDAKILYQGAVPDLVAGIFQVNALIPVAVTPGPAVPVLLTVNGISSRNDVTMSVMQPDPTRLGRIAYFNNGTTDLTVGYFQPGNSVPAGTIVVKAGVSSYVGSATSVGNDWGVQVGSGLQRVVGNVCSWAGINLPAGTAPYWQCTGSAAQPFPR